MFVLRSARAPTGLVAMTSASHAEGCQFDPGWVYVGPRPAYTCLVGLFSGSHFFCVELFGHHSGQISRRCCWKLSGCPDAGLLHECLDEFRSKRSQSLCARVPGSPRRTLATACCSALAGRGPGESNRHRVSVSSGKNDLKKAGRLRV